MRPTVVCGQRHIFPRPYTLNKKNNKGILTLNNRPVVPKRFVNSNGDLCEEAVFESTIPIFQCAENTEAFRDDVLRRIDVRSCEWVVSRDGNENGAVFSTRTTLLDAFDTKIQNSTHPTPFQFQGDDVMEKLILHSVAIFVVDIISFTPANKKLNMTGRLWVPPSNIGPDIEYLSALYNHILYDIDQDSLDNL